jgi:hypothetical protein
MNGTIRIGSAEVALNQADEAWIHQQINRRRTDGVAVCVQVRIKDRDVDVVLQTPTCAGGAGGARQPNPREQRVLGLWNERGLNQSTFTGGNVVAFLHQVRRLL